MAPSGIGVEYTRMRGRSLSTQKYTVEVPWRAAFLTKVGRSYRSGSPFHSFAGPIELRQDLEGAAATPQNLPVNRMGEVSIGWVAEVRRPVPIAETRGDGVWVQNRSSVEYDRVFFCSGEG